MNVKKILFSSFFKIFRQALFIPNVPFQISVVSKINAHFQKKNRTAGAEKNRIFNDGSPGPAVFPILFQPNGKRIQYDVLKMYKCLAWGPLPAPPPHQDAVCEENLKFSKLGDKSQQRWSQAALWFHRVEKFTISAAKIRNS